MSRRPFHTSSPSPPTVGGFARQRQRISVGTNIAAKGSRVSVLGGGLLGGLKGAIFKLPEPLSWFVLGCARDQGGGGVRMRDSGARGTRVGSARSRQSGSGGGERGRRTRGWFLEFGSRGHLVLVS